MLPKLSASIVAVHLSKILIAKSITLRYVKRYQLTSMNIITYIDHPFIRNSLLEPKKCMKKELCERGNGVGSEDVGTNSNSSDEGGSNQIPVLSKALAGTSLLSSTFESSVPTSLVCSSSLPIPYLTKVAQQPKLTCI